MRLPQGHWKESEIKHGEEGTCQIAAFKELAEVKGGSMETEKDVLKPRRNIIEGIVNGEQN